MAHRGVSASLPLTIQPYRASRTLQPQNDAELFMRNEKLWCTCFSPPAYDFISGVMVMWTLWSKDYSICPAGCGLWPSHTNASLFSHLQKKWGEAYLLTGRKQTMFVLLKRNVWSQVSDVLLKWQEREWRKTAMTSHSFTFTFMHLADAFIQSDLHCILSYSFTFYQLIHAHLSSEVCE